MTTSPSNTDQDAWLLTTKLYVPPVPAEFVPRPRLIEVLNAGLPARHKMTLVSAPAGFGKTTLLSAWVAGVDRAVAWLSLDEGDNDPVRFWSYLVAALQTIHAGVGETILGALQSPQPPPIESLLVGLINDVAALPPEPRFLLVLDDYHVIDEARIHDGLRFWLQHQPPRVHLVIATRKDPPLSLARLRARGWMTEIRATDLRFTGLEAAAFLNQAMGLDLAPDEVAALETRTEGWVAGLRMAAFSLERQADRSGFIRAFAGDDRHVMDYLVDEVLSRQSGEVRDFLLRTAILDRLSGPLCDAVRFGEAGPPAGDEPSGGSQEILEYLEQANLFVVPLDSKRQWYRYHHLFADLLRYRLRRERPGRVSELHRRASAWYEDQGFIREAVDHALAEEDPERAADLVQRHTFAMLYRSETRTVLNWLNALPESVRCAHPMLCIFHAWALALVEQTGPRDAVEEKLRTAEEGVASLEPGRPLRDLITGHAASVRAYLVQSSAQPGYDPHEVIALSRRAQSLLPDDEMGIRSVNALNIGGAYLALGDAEGAYAAYEETRRMGEMGGNTYVAVYAVYGQALILWVQARLNEALELCRRGIQSFEALLERSHRTLPAIGSLYVALGQVLLEQNEMAEAERALRHGLDQMQWTGEFETQIVGHTALARLHRARGDADGALRAISRLERVWPTGGAYVAALRALHHLWLARRAPGALDAALRWAHEHRPSPDEDPPSLGIGPGGEARHVEQLTWARVLIAHAHRRTEARVSSILEPVLSHLARWRTAAQAGGLVGRVLELSLLEALVFEAQGRTDRALDALAPALDRAAPEGYVRLFVDEGPAMSRLLHEAASRGIAPAYAGRLLAAFADSGLAPQEEEDLKAGPAGAPEEPLIEPLSERELEVLSLVAQGLTNREIAQRLFLSPHTVRAHTSNIYGKLAVHNRTEAVARARALGILPPFAPS